MFQFESCLGEVTCPGEYAFSCKGIIGSTAYRIEWNLGYTDIVTPFSVADTVADEIPEVRVCVFQFYIVWFYFDVYDI